MEAKVKITWHDKVIELEGSEEFVRKYLEEFKNLVIGQSSPVNKPMPQKTFSPAVAKKSEGPKNKTFFKNPEPIQFDTKGNGQKPSLREFVASKAPQSNREIITCIAFYLKKYMKMEEFNEGHVSYAYLDLQKKRPEAFHQLFLDTKNDNRWLVPGKDATTWKLYQIGEDYVEHDLPRKNAPDKK